MLPVFGARGDVVAALQNALIGAGVEVFGGADGIFGNATKTAISKFQTARTLAANGALDAPTAIELGLLPRPVLAVTIPVFPVRPACYFVDSWMESRGANRKHEGVDIVASRGQEVLAVADGTITKIYTADTAKLSGNAVRLTMGDGTYFFYAHLDTFAPGIAVGSKVAVGQVIGTVGSTGATTPHLHFEVHPQGGAAVNPYPIVKAVDACKK
jgi:murein DD-endopeptidase MepM/ murein hydrolase activator NlpD